MALDVAASITRLNIQAVYSDAVSQIDRKLMNRDKFDRVVT